MAPVLSFGGEESFTVTPDRLYRELTDPQSLAATIPDLQSSELAEDGTLRCVVRPGFSFLRGTLKLTIRFTELSPPSDAQSSGHAAMEVQSQGIGATIDIASRMQIEPAAGGSRLVWKAEIMKLQGLVATVSKPLIQGAAGQVAQQTWAKVRQRLQTTT